MSANRMEPPKEVMTCPRDGNELWGRQYDPRMTPQAWDGISEWFCPDEKCGYRRGRWSGKILGPLEFEDRSLRYAKR